jgi:hypothetical protein
MNAFTMADAIADGRERRIFIRDNPNPPTAFIFDGDSGGISSGDRANSWGRLDLSVAKITQSLVITFWRRCDIAIYAIRYLNICDAKYGMRNIEHSKSQ